MRDEGRFSINQDLFYKEFWADVKVKAGELLASDLSPNLREYWEGRLKEAEQQCDAYAVHNFNGEL